MGEGLPRHRQTTELQKGLSGIGAPPRRQLTVPVILMWGALWVIVAVVLGMILIGTTMGRP